ncbi:hypothetical protein [Streptomyces avermitilis]|uniref:hypothetical protein n=1 Tax=Streptomyces avermitilis TaxID=33903 RepID=UPI00382F7542
MSAAEQYAADYAVIEQDLTEAQSLEFGAYVGFLAHYGAKLQELAYKHPDQQEAYRRLLKHSDDFLEGLNGS